MSFDTGIPYNYLYCFFLFLSMFGTVPFIAFMIHQTKILLERQKTVMTIRTYRMHNELLRTLIFQLAVPSITLLIPYIGTVALALVGIENISYIFQANYILGTLHSTMNTLMMVYFIKPYRVKFCTNIWYKPKQFLSDQWNIYGTTHGSDSSTLRNSLAVNHNSYSNIRSSTVPGLAVRPSGASFLP